MLSQVRLIPISLAADLPPRLAKCISVARFHNVDFTRGGAVPETKRVMLNSKTSLCRKLSERCFCGNIFNRRTLRSLAHQALRPLRTSVNCLAAAARSRWKLLFIPCFVNPCSVRDTNRRILCTVRRFSRMQLNHERREIHERWR